MRSMRLFCLTAPTKQRSPSRPLFFRLQTAALLIGAMKVVMTIMMMNCWSSLRLSCVWLLEPVFCMSFSHLLECCFDQRWRWRHSRSGTRFSTMHGLVAMTTRWLLSFVHSTKNIWEIMRLWLHRHRRSKHTRASEKKKTKNGFNSHTQQLRPAIAKISNSSSLSSSPPSSPRPTKQQSAIERTTADPGFAALLEQLSNCVEI